MAAENGRERLELVNKNEILELSRSEEEGVALLERHRRAELRLIIVIAQVSDLVQVAAKRKDKMLT